MIPGDVGDPIEPITTCDKKTFEFDIEDRQKVEELRKWWRVRIFLYNSEYRKKNCSYPFDDANVIFNSKW